MFTDHRAYFKALLWLVAAISSGIPRGWGLTPPEIPKALQNRAKLNLIVKTVKNC